MIQDNPFADLIPQNGQQPQGVPGVIIGRPRQMTPQQMAAEERANAAAAREDVRFSERNDRPPAAPPSGYRFNTAGNLEAIPGGPSDPARPPTAKAIPEARIKDFEKQFSTYDGLARSLNSFQDDYGGNAITGGLENTIQGLNSSFGSPGQRDWWAQFRATDNIIRNELFGAALTPSEQAAYTATTVSERMDPAEIRRNLQRRENIVRDGLKRRVELFKARGYNPQEIDALVGAYGFDGDNPAPIAGGQPVPTDNRPMGEVEFGNTGGLPPGTAEYQREVEAGVRDGTISTPDDLAAVATKYGYVPPDREASERFFEGFRRGVPFGGAGAPEFASVQRLNAEMQANRGDQILDPLVRGAADTMSLGFADEVSGIANAVASGGNVGEEIALQRAVDDFDNNNNFAPRLTGQIAGGFGLPVGQGRSALDLARVGAMYGAGYGAGSADGNLGDRALGALGGGIAGGAAGYGLARLGQAAAGRFGGGGGGGDPRAPGRELMEAAQRQGVDVLPADVGGPMTRRMTSGMAQTPFGSGPVTRAADGAVDSFATARNRVAAEAGDIGNAAEIGNAIRDRAAVIPARAAASIDDSRAAAQGVLGDAYDATGAGQVAQRGANAFITQSAERSSGLYNRIPIEAGQPASVNETRAALADLNEGFRSNPEMGRLFDNPFLQRVQSALRREVDPETGEVIADQGLSWGDLSGLRTRVGDMLEDARLSEKIPSRQLRTLYASLTRDMETTAQEQGGAAYRAWRRANNFERGRNDRIENTLSKVLGMRRDRTANEAFSAVERMTRDAAGGDFANLGRLLRSLPREDAMTLRASIVGRAGEGAKGFSPQQFAKDWSSVSDRAKAYLFPNAASRQMMDQAAARARDIVENPFEGMTGNEVFSSLQGLAAKGGDANALARDIANLSPEDASAVRATIVSRLGEPSAGQQNAAENAFSPSSFLTQWVKLDSKAKDVLFGRSGQLRSSLDDLAVIADGMKQSQRYAGFSNTGAVNSVNATTGGLAGAVGALMLGQPLVAAGLAAPAAWQAGLSRLLVSPRFTKWLVRAAKDRSPVATERGLQSLAAIASREPAIANDILPLQEALQSSISRAAASDQEQQRRQ